MVTMPPSAPAVPISPELAAEFERSLARCLAQGDFIQAFYERFLGDSPEARAKFAHTDFAKQKLVLERSLYLMARAALGLEDGLEHLGDVARSHSRRRLDIGPALYEQWLTALLATAREFDPQFNERIERSWYTLLNHAIAVMVSVYRRSDTARMSPISPGEESKG